jgi:hypothetical protein
VCHFYCEVNACTNALANMGFKYEQCPSRLSSLLLVDAMAITTPTIIVV